MNIFPVSRDNANILGVVELEEMRLRFKVVYEVEVSVKLLFHEVKLEKLVLVYKDQLAVIINVKVEGVAH
jgi:hypothetical protein